MLCVFFGKESKTGLEFDIEHHQQKWQCKPNLQLRANPAVIVTKTKPMFMYMKDKSGRIMCVIRRKLSVPMAKYIC